ncbi:MAG TPA: RNA polymerase sigma factor [Chloroflexi bacterium]|jgi:RNA polymerase sigma-70 factor (ECF subfamily)|nr:RNA polymerase sigma factor [Chloroflexota bacterium]
MGKGRGLADHFDGLYDRFARPVHAYFLGHTGDDQVALDLMQETFLRVWRHRAELEDMPEERLRYWLFGIGQNLLTDFYRRQAVRSVVTHSTPEVLEAYPDAGSERSRALREQALDIDAAIARLPEELREVLAMSVLGEMTSGEIGQALGRPAGTVRYQLSQARHALSAMLELARQ